MFLGKAMSGLLCWTYCHGNFNVVKWMDGWMDKKADNSNEANINFYCKQYLIKITFDNHIFLKYGQCSLYVVPFTSISPLTHYFPLVSERNEYITRGSNFLQNK